MRVTDVWLIYVLLVLGVYLLLSFCNCRLQWSMITRLLVAFVIGLIAILIMIPSTLAITEGERTLYTLLLILAIAIPILLALWMAWSKKMIPGMNQGSDEGVNEDGYRVDRKFKCDDEGCHLVRMTRVKAGEKENYLYQ
jgi:hypothetical protein